jgi:uncharacterized membrane protein YfhO
LDDVVNACSYKVIEKDTLSALRSELSARKVTYTIENTSSVTSFKASVQTAGEGEYLFLNYVSLKGHTAYVNGKKVALQENGLNMLLVPLEQGENEVVIEYRSPYITYTAVVVAVSLVALLAFAVLLTGRRRERTFARIKTPVAVIAVLIVLVVVGLFMVYPTAVMIYKLTGL